MRNKQKLLQTQQSTVSSNQATQSPDYVLTKSQIPQLSQNTVSQQMQQLQNASPKTKFVRMGQPNSAPMQEESKTLPEQNDDFVPMPLATKVNFTSKQAQYKNRQRVKSLQTVLPLQSLTQRSSHVRNPTQKDEFNASNSIGQAAPKRHSTSQSVGNRPHSHSKNETHIKLVVRIRPTLSHESAQQCIQLTQSIDPQLMSKKGGADEHIIKLTKGYSQISFKFDQVLDEASTQAQCYEKSSHQIVENFLMIGSSATIFAYGQTGAGKTYTIMGGNKKTKSNSKKVKLANNEKKGILPRIIDQLFQGTNNKGQPSPTTERQFLVSFFEIYNDKVYDLLKPPMIASNTSTPSSNADKNNSGGIQREQLTIREERDGNFVVNDLKKVLVTAKQEAYIWLDKGLQNRQVASTANNATSSRSHTIFQIETYSQYGDNSQFSSKLRIVDLAGSEKFSQSIQNQLIKKQEQTSINLSLSSLGKCISALGNGKRQHIPFRDSKLTKILKDSLMQPSDTALQTVVSLVICISPSLDSYQETQSTLQFANGAKKALLNQAPMLMNSPSISMSSISRNKYHQLENAMNEIQKLRKENSDLKNQVSDYRRVLKHSNSQGSIQITPLDADFNGSKADYNQAQMIDLRLSKNGQEDGVVVVMEHNDSSVQYQTEIKREEIEEPEIILRSCFKGCRKLKDPQEQEHIDKVRVVFKRMLDNNESLDSQIAERVEHNMKYNDDTIFDGLSIFQDVNTYKKVHGAKDKFNAKSLLSTPIEEIPVSDEEEEDKKVPAQVKDVESGSSVSEQSIGKAKQKDGKAAPKQVNMMDSQEESKDEVAEDGPLRESPAKDVQEFESQNQQELFNSFLPDLPSMIENNGEQIQETLNLSNDISQDLIELGNDKQFSNAFKSKDSLFKKSKGKTSDQPSLPGEGSFFKFVDGKDNNLSGSIHSDNQENKMETSPTPHQTDQEIQPGDLLKPQEKSLFQADLSIISGGKDRDDRVEFTAQNIVIEGENEMRDDNRDQIDQLDQMQQQQSTLILDEEEVAPVSNPTNNPSASLTDQESRHNTTPKLSFTKNEIECNLSGNMISFDTSRISPDNANNMNSSTHNQNHGFEKIVGQLNAWNPKEQDNFKPPQNSLKPEFIMQDEERRQQPTSNNQAVADEILAHSLTNTFSTIQSLDGELTALRRMSKKHTPDRARKQNIKSTVIRDFNDQPESSERVQRNILHKQITSSYGDLDRMKKHSSQSMEPKKQQKSILKPKLASKQIQSLKMEQQQVQSFTKMRGEAHAEENMTDQSISVDLTTISKDLQSYYSKIHSQIAQLKDVLVSTQQQQLRNSQQHPNIQHNRPQMLPLSEAPQQRQVHLMKQTLVQQPIQPTSQKTPPPVKRNKLKDQTSQGINVDAILRTQELIEQVKRVILSSINEREQLNQEEQQSNQIFRNPYVDSQELSFQPNSPPKRHDRLGVALESNDLQEQQSRNVVNLLQELQGELLESIPENHQGRNHQMPSMSQQAKLVKRINLHPQYEEIEGSQERSPYTIRHMHVQRQNWIQMEEFKEQQRLGQKSLPRFNELDTDEQAPVIMRQSQAARLCGTLELTKKVLSDSTEINITATSAAILGDQSSHVIQQPLPVNRIQKKITKDLHYEKSHLAGVLNKVTEQAPEDSTPDKNKQNRSNQKSHGPKMLGVGTGAVAADHTLTLIFDSDDEQIIDNSLTQNTIPKQKRLSEVVEDYFNEGNQMQNNVPQSKKQITRFGSGLKSGNGGSQGEDVFNPKQDGISNRDSFMHESSMLNLFAGGVGAVDRNSFAETSNGGRLLGSFTQTKAPSGNQNFNLRREMEDDLFFGAGMQDQSSDRNRRSLSIQNNPKNRQNLKGPDGLPILQEIKEDGFDNVGQPDLPNIKSPTPQVKKIEPAKILPQQKWAPPPKLKNLRSNKRGAKNKQDNMLFSTRPPIMQASDSATMGNENVLITHEQLSFEERKDPQPTNLIYPPGTQHVDDVKVPISLSTPAAVLVRKQTSELNQNRNDISSYSENFNEDEHQEQSNTSTKQSVRNYLNQFFNPSVKLHMQQNQQQQQMIQQNKKKLQQMQMKQIKPHTDIAGVHKSSNKKASHTQERRRDALPSSQNENKKTADRVNAQARVILNLQKAAKSKEREQKKGTNKMRGPAFFEK